MTTPLITRGGALGALADTLGITPEQHRQISAVYDDLGGWLKQHADSPCDVTVYPQGSQRIGTTNQDPFTGHFDGDAVVRVGLKKENISQKQLNELVGGWLTRYHRARQSDGHPLAPQDLELKTRAWTLTYPRFHLDILPVVPVREIASEVRDPSWLTDKTLRYWQPTDPRGFAGWFDEVSAEERERQVAAKAAERDVDVQDLPPLTVKSTLQLAVQLLKRHRDNMFGDDADDVAPPSIVVTTLAGRAYEALTPAGGPLEAVLDTIVPAMIDYIELRKGVLWIPNPRYDAENYADRYRDRLDRHVALKQWLAQAADDFDLDTAGLDRVAAAIDKGFGSNLGGLVIKRMTGDVQNARDAGKLGTTGTGGLAIATTVSSRRHTFYGGSNA